MLAVLSVASAAAVFAADARVSEPVVMEAFKVEKIHKVKLAFGMSLDVWNAGNGKVKSIVVWKVRETTDAADQGVIPLTRIYRINGRPIEEFDATLRRSSELGKLFVDRKNGDQIVLEIGLPGHPDLRTVVLTERHTILSGMSSLMENKDR
jgi:hypothetical protein